MLLLALLFPVLVSVLLTPLSSNKAFEGSQKILLLTAHPDDECLFFAPTVLTLPAEVELHSLCLSTGNADGLGQIRKSELESSLDVLGIAKDRRLVVDSPNLQDNITVVWEPESIAREVETYVQAYHIDVILTFDGKGISDHPNHASLPYGVLEVLNSKKLAKPLRAYSLVTVPSVPKYMGPVAPLLAKVDIMFARFVPRLGITHAGIMYPVFVSGIKEYSTGVKAMMRHRSQMVWFRWLNVAFSRYMWVNEWAEISPEIVGDR